MGSARATLRRIPRALWAFLAIQLVLVVLLVMGVGSLFSVGSKESLRAANTQQRVVIDAATGKVLSPLAAETPEDAALPAYDVAPSEPTPPPVAPEVPAATPETPAAPEVPEPSPAAETAPASTAERRLDTGKEPAIAAIARGKESLIPAPAPEVSETSAKGVLPKSTKDASPSTLYARTYRWPAEESPPALAVLVVGLGMNARSMEAALALPPDVAFSFTPYGKNVAQWVEWARNAGHEAWMDLPAQTQDFPRTDPGPYGIFKGLDATQVEAKMHEAMRRFPGFVGMTLPIGQGTLTESSIAVPMLEELGKRGLLLAVPTSDVRLSQIAHAAPHERAIFMADTVIDSTPSEAFILARLSKLENELKTNGHAFAVISDTPLSLRVLGEWLKGLKAKNIVLVPPTAIPYAPDGEGVRPPTPEEAAKPEDDVKTPAAGH